MREAENLTYTECFLVCLQGLCANRILTGEICVPSIIGLAEDLASAAYKHITGAEEAIANTAKQTR